MTARRTVVSAHGAAADQGVDHLDPARAECGEQVPEPCPGANVK